MEFELMVWGDGTIRLAHWDRLHGDDIVITLGKDGTATGTGYGRPEQKRGLEPYPIDNLVLFLRQLAQREKRE
jgi:hypothetical protein